MCVNYDFFHDSSHFSHKREKEKEIKRKEGEREGEEKEEKRKGEEKDKINCMFIQ